MANKQPLKDHGHESKRWTDSSQSIESKIHDACCKNETQKVTHFLLRRKNDINAKKLEEFGSLFVAIDNDNFLIVDGLLGIGCNPNVMNSEHKPALFVALVNGNMCIASSLIDHGANVRKTLFLAIRKGLSDIVKKVLELQVNVGTLKDKKGYTPLCLAIDLNNLEIVKLLSKHYADTNIKEKSDITPLILAVTNGNTEIVKELLKNGAQVDGKSSIGLTAFMNAWIDKQMDVAKILLDYGADVDFCWQDRSTVLHDASSDGNLENVKFLLEHNANVYAVDDEKCTPLHLATENDHAKVVKLLLSSGANDLIIRNEEGNTAFESAFAKNNIEVAKMIAYHDHF